MIKKLLTKSSKFILIGFFAIAAFAATSNTSLAQWDVEDWGIYNTTDPGNYGNWGNVNVDYVNNACGWSTQCPTNTSWGTPAQDWGITNTTNQGTYTGWTNPNVDFVGNYCDMYNCAPTSNPSNTYIPATTYTNPTPTNTYIPAPTYTGYTGGSYYVSPTNTYIPAPTYTVPVNTYTYTNPTPTNTYIPAPTYTSPTPVNTYIPAPIYNPAPVYNPAPTYNTTTNCPAGTHYVAGVTIPIPVPGVATINTTVPGSCVNNVTNVSTPAPVNNPAPSYNTNNSSWYNYAPVTTTNTSNTTNTNWSYTNTNTVSNSNNSSYSNTTNTNNTCAGTNNCNTAYSYNYAYNNSNNSINGSFNTTYTQPTYTQPTPVCTNGTTNYPACTLCPYGLVLQNGSCVTRTTTCPAGQYLSGGYCIAQTRVCPNGQTINYWEVCPNQTQTCWNGAVIPVTSVCPSQYKTCPNGTTVLITQQCYKTCPNGTTVLDTQTCNRTCPNGTVVPEYQFCPTVSNYPTVDININPSVVNRGESAILTWTSQNATYCTASNGWSGNVNLSGSMNRSNLLDNTTYTIVCYNSQGQSATDSTTVTVRQNLPTSHRVVTTAPTQITKTSARCNGVGVISNGVYSSGWFEYGETRDLGRVTNSASIGNLPSSPFGNTITGLKANTTYYCRAVMSNANGTYRGEILSFRTTGETVTYIPVTPSNPKTPIKPIICTDDTGAKESLTDGEKLMTITLDKKSGIVAVGNTIEYRAHYLNDSKIKLTNTTMKMVLPSDMTFVSSNRGVYDETNNTVSANLDTVPAGASGDMIVTVKVKDAASAGKSAVISSYISYDALDSKGNPIRDENTAYIISTIASAEGAVQKNTDVTSKVSNTTTSDRSFLPNTVLEWLAIIALILVMIVLGRAIYTGLKGEAHNHH